MLFIVMFSPSGTAKSKKKINKAYSFHEIIKYVDTIVIFRAI